MKFKKRKAIYMFLFLSSFSFFSQPRLDLSAQENPPAPALISLDVKDADIRDIMRMFSQVSGLNIIISEDVKAKITLSVVDVNWEDTLNMILRTNNLALIKDGAFLRIMTFDKLKREEEGVPLVNEAVCLNFAKADEMVSILDPLRSSRGKINAHSQTNTVVITDIPDNFKKMLAVIEKLDKRTPQVMIEAMMLDVKLTDSEQMGINWSVTDAPTPVRSMTQTLSASRTEGVIRYGKMLLPNTDFYAAIDFWAQNKKAEILANPKVLTLDGLPAHIELNDEIPYLSSTVSGTDGDLISTTASFREAGIKMDVTPHISSGGYISLAIKTEQSFQSSTVSTSDGSQPVIDSRKADTNLLVKDGETIVIGGLRKKNTTRTIDKLPILGDIPFLGKFFRRNVEEVVNSELLIFVTPHIINESQLSSQEERGLSKFRRLKAESLEMEFLDRKKKLK
jgi:type IV pilus assembly protein PilQ